MKNKRIILFIGISLILLVSSIFVFAQDALNQADQLNLLIPQIQEEKQKNINTKIEEYNKLKISLESQEYTYDTLNQYSIDPKIAATALYDNAKGYLQIAQFAKTYHDFKHPKVSSTLDGTLAEQIAKLKYNLGLEISDVYAEKTANEQITIKYKLKKTREVPSYMNTLKTGTQDTQELQLTPGSVLDLGGLLVLNDDPFQITDNMPSVLKNGEEINKIVLRFYPTEPTGETVDNLKTEGVSSINVNIPATTGQTTPTSQNTQSTTITNADSCVKAVYNKHNQVIQQEVTNARLSHITVPLIYGVISQESICGNANAISPTGAIGLMQLTQPAVDRSIIQKLKVCGSCSSSANCHIGSNCKSNPPTDDRFNPSLNIRNGIKVLNNCFKSFNGYVAQKELAIGCYNAGAANIKRILADVRIPSTATWSQIENNENFKRNENSAGDVTVVFVNRILAYEEAAKKMLETPDQELDFSKDKCTLCNEQEDCKETGCKALVGCEWYDAQWPKSNYCRPIANDKCTLCNENEGCGETGCKALVGCEWYAPWLRSNYCKLKEVEPFTQLEADLKECAEKNWEGQVTLCKEISPVLDVTQKIEIYSNNIRAMSTREYQVLKERYTTNLYTISTIKDSKIKKLSMVGALEPDKIDISSGSKIRYFLYLCGPDTVCITEETYVAPPPDSAVTESDKENREISPQKDSFAIVLRDETGKLVDVSLNFKDNTFSTILYRFEMLLTNGATKYYPKKTEDPLKKQTIDNQLKNILIKYSDIGISKGEEIDQISIIYENSANTQEYPNKKLIYLKDPGPKLSADKCSTCHAIYGEECDKATCNALAGCQWYEFNLEQDYCGQKNIADYGINTLYRGDLDVYTRQRTSNPTHIVLHHTAGSNVKDAIDTLKKRELSANYIIASNGEIFQIADDNKVTYHAGCLASDSSCVKAGMNEVAIGIEIVNTGYPDDKFDKVYPNLKTLLKTLTDKYNMPYDDEHILAHYEIDTKKPDPSPNFDWSKIGLPNHLSYFSIHNKCPFEFIASNVDCTLSQFYSVVPEGVASAVKSTIGDEPSTTTQQTTQQEPLPAMQCAAIKSKDSCNSQNTCHWVDTNQGILDSFFSFFSRTDSGYCENKATTQATTQPQTDTSRLSIDNNYLNKFTSYATRRSSDKINYIVVHLTGPGALPDDVIKKLNDKGSSVHYIIARDGGVYKILDENKVAYHADCDSTQPSCIIPNINPNSIAIEIINAGIPSDRFAERIYTNLGILLRDIAQRNNIPYDNQHIIGYYEVNSENYDPSPNFDWSKIGLTNHISYFQKYNKCPPGFTCYSNPTAQASTTTSSST